MLAHLGHLAWNVAAVIGISAVAVAAALVALKVATDRGWVGPT
jgi:hypothetical protein